MELPPLLHSACILAAALALTAPSLPAESAETAGLHFGIDPLDFFQPVMGKGGFSAAGAQHTPPFESDSHSLRQVGIPITASAATYTHRFESDFDSLPGDISSDEFLVVAPVLPLSYDRLRIGALVSYRANWFDASTPTLVPDDTLHAFRLPVVALYDLSADWLVGAMVMPGFSGDFTSGGDSFSILSALAVGYRVSDTLRVFAGGLSAHGFDENRFFPGLGFMWQPSEHWSVNLLPPLAAITYDCCESYKLSLFARFDSPTWNVEADTAGPARDITLREIRAGLRLERHVADRLWAFLAGGVTFARRLEVETLGSRSLQEDDIDPGAFIQGGLTLRF